MNKNKTDIQKSREIGKVVQKASKINPKSLPYSKGDSKGLKRERGFIEVRYKTV